MLTLVNPLEIEGYTVYRDDSQSIANANAGVTAKMTADQAKVAATDPANADSSSSAPAPSGSSAAKGKRPPSTQFYVLPKIPTIATTSDGKPMFSLVVYRQAQQRLDPNAAASTDVGGGILTFTAELTVPDADMAKITSKLKTLVYGDDTDDGSDVNLSQVEFIDGKITVAVAGEDTAETTPGMFIKSAVGTGKVSGIGGNQKAVMVNLTQNGAALMSQIDKLRVLPINLDYDLTFEHRLMGVTMRVWCDVTSSYHLLQANENTQTGETSGYLGTGLGSQDIDAQKITSVTETMMSSKTMGVTVTPGTSQIDNDTITSLEKFGEDMLTKELAQVISAAPPSDKNNVDRQYLDKYFSDASDSLNFTLDQRMVLTRDYDPSTNIANILNRADLKDLVTYVDLGVAMFALIKIPVRVNADFTKLPISQVGVTINYTSKSDVTNQPTTVSAGFVFTDGATINNFIAYANTLDAVTYDWTAEVHYKDSQDPYRLAKSKVKDKFLIVDVGTLGLISVDVGLGLVDLDKFPQAVLTIRYVNQASGFGEEQSQTFDKDNQEWTWTDTIREDSTGAYQYKVDWRQKSDGSILAGQWIPSNSQRLKLDAPVSNHLDISVIASGNFKDVPDPLMHVAVSLKYDDPANNYHPATGMLDFTDDKQMLAWSVELENASLLDYQYRFDLIYKGGLVKHMPPDGTSWLPGQPGFLVVGEKFALEVDLYPFLLMYDNRSKVVQVDLIYTTPTNPTGITGSYIFNQQNSTQKTWRVGDDPAGPTTYSVVITYYGADGTQIKQPAYTSSSSALVIPPPPPPAPTST